MEIVVVALLAFGGGLGLGRWSAKRPAPSPLPAPAPVPVAAVQAAPVPRVVRGEPQDARPERFTLYVDQVPLTGADDWREIRDLWRTAGPTRAVWDRERASWR